jgi:CheY-like chemotaxis protein
LKMGRFDEKQVRATSEIIARQVDHMTHLVDDLLDVSRVTRGLVALDRESLDLKVIVDHAVEQVRSLLESRHHRLTVQLAAEPAFVFGDRVRLVQIIANLLNNAAKFTPPSGAISLAIELTPHEVELRVIDNGIGIAADLIPEVFNLFAQGERSVDRAQGGLGLGLALVKSVAALHGGSAMAESDGPGKGSRFSIRLPRIEAPEKPAGQREVASDHAAEGQLRIMIVDDNLDALETLANLLRAYGHTVSAVHDAKEARREAVVHPAEVFILDIGLPDMDGYTLAHELQALPGMDRALYIALTGYGRNRAREQSAATRIDHHLMKPVNTEMLVTLLAERGTHRVHAH